MSKKNSNSRCNRNSNGNRKDDKRFNLSAAIGTDVAEVLVKWHDYGTNTKTVFLALAKVYNYMKAMFEAEESGDYTKCPLRDKCANFEDGKKEDDENPSDDAHTDEPSDAPEKNEQHEGTYSDIRQEKIPGIDNKKMNEALKKIDEVFLQYNMLEFELAKAEGREINFDDIKAMAERIVKTYIKKIVGLDPIDFKVNLKKDKVTGDINLNITYKGLAL